MSARSVSPTRTPASRAIDVCLGFFRRLTVTLALLSLATPAGATPHELVWANAQDISVLDPLVPGTAAREFMSAATMAYLTRAADGPLEPELATQVPTVENGGVSGDGRTVTFRLRPLLKWSDGQPLTSDDVAFSIHAIKEPKSIAGEQTGFAEISSVETPDATSIVVHLSRPSGQIVSRLFCEGSFPILPRHLLQGKDVDTAAYMQLPVGAGPFRYSKWLRGDRIELERNPYYFRGTVKLQKLIFRIIPNLQSTALALRTGEIDFWPGAAKETFDQLSDVVSLKASVLHDVRPQMLVFNTTSAPLDDVAVRSALRLALDRGAIVEKIYHGGAGFDESLVSADDPAYLRLEPYAHDLASATATLEDAGWKAGADGIRMKDGNRLTVSLVGVAGNASVDQMFELIRNDWRAAGVDVQTRTFVPSILFSRDPQRGIFAAGRFGAGLYSLGQLRARDLADLFSCKNVGQGGSNVSRLCDPALDALFDRYAVTTDEKSATSLARKLQQRLNDLEPAIVVVKRSEYYILRDSVVGFRPHPFSPFAGVIDVDVLK